jgi:phage-related protein
MAVDEKQKPKTIDLVIVYGVNRELTVSEADTIGEVKTRALELFGIDQSELNNYVLRAKIHGDKDEQLDEARTVESYDLHNKEKVTLAAGTPFGAVR